MLCFANVSLRVLTPPGGSLAARHGATPAGARRPGAACASAAFAAFTTAQILRTPPNSTHRTEYKNKDHSTIPILRPLLLSVGLTSISPQGITPLQSAISTSKIGSSRIHYGLGRRSTMGPHHRTDFCSVCHNKLQATVFAPDHETKKENVVSHPGTHRGFCFGEFDTAEGKLTSQDRRGDC